MKDRTIGILLVEDDDGDASLVRRALRRDWEASRFRLQRVSTAQEAVDRLGKGNVDVVLLDLHLPDSQGVETVLRIREQDADVAIVVFTVAGDDETALRVLQAGAQDYLVKGEFSGSLLRRAVRYAIERQRMQRENRRLNERLTNAAKYESLGTLAGGIAHDFNNLMQVVLMNAELLKDASNGSTHGALGAISAAATVASRLTNQLLVYSGDAALEIQRIDIREVIRDAESALSSLLSDNVVLRVHVGDDCPPVEADPNQLQQLILNLVINASDAIGEEQGTVELTAGSIEVEDPCALDLVSGRLLASGRLLYVEVRDSGCGMDSRTVEKIFDPFYTTKELARGLGLASVLGTVRSHGGGLGLRSRPGAGSTFTAYFPQSSKTSSRTLSKPSAERRGLEREGFVLVVDDNAAVCDCVCRTLEHFGYSVLAAEGGLEALEIFRSRGDEIDLVLLDLVMPEMDGQRTFAELRSLEPDLKVILMSGFDARECARQLLSAGVSGTLRKPFDPNELAAMVKEALEAA